MLLKTYKLRNQELRDVDMAKEMMKLTLRQNILQQAAQAMLAQANQAPQGVLTIIKII